jgi:GAF domain
MKTFIRVIEVWVPDPGGTLLEFGGGLYGSARAFGAISRRMCFGRGEGLPGRVWDSGRPIILKQLADNYFLRARAAAAEGLTCAIALPIFAGDRLNAVLVIFCGDDEAHVGAIELWRNDAANSPDLKLDEGYYGGTADIFEFLSRHMCFRKGNGLPGLAWESGLPVFMPDLGKGSRFLRADGARKVGINRGFALRCSTAGPDAYVMTFLSALATPIVRRYETWLPDAECRTLSRREGFCEVRGTLDGGGPADRVGLGDGALGRAFSSGVPVVAEAADQEPGLVGAGARDAGLKSLVALPLLRDGRAPAVAAWYF